MIVKNRLSISLFDGTETNAQIVDILMENKDEESKPSVEAFVKEIRDNLEELEGMELITFKSKDIIHCQRTRYCKEELPREIFPNRRRVFGADDLAEEKSVNPLAELSFRENGEEGKELEVIEDGEYSKDLGDDQGEGEGEEEVTEKKPKRDKPRERLNTSDHIKSGDPMMLATKRSEGPMTSDRNLLG